MDLLERYEAIMIKYFQQLDSNIEKIKNNIEKNNIEKTLDTNFQQTLENAYNILVNQKRYEYDQHIYVLKNIDGSRSIMKTVIENFENN